MRRDHHHVRQELLTALSGLAAGSGPAIGTACTAAVTPDGGVASGAITMAGPGLLEVQAQQADGLQPELPKVREACQGLQVMQEGSGQDLAAPQAHLAATGSFPGR